MNKWLNLSIIGILMIGLVVSLSLLFQAYDRLSNAEIEVTALKSNISDLEYDLSKMGESAHFIIAELSARDPSSIVMSTADNGNMP